MQRDPLASTKARKAERRADEKSGLLSFKPVKLEPSASASKATPLKVSSVASGGGFKKGGFKSAFGGEAVDVKMEDDGEESGVAGVLQEKTKMKGEGREEEEESETDGEYEYYDPRRPTDCYEGCLGRS